MHGTVVVCGSCRNGCIAGRMKPSEEFTKMIGVHFMRHVKRVSYYLFVCLDRALALASGQFRN